MLDPFISPEIFFLGFEDGKHCNPYSYEMRLSGSGPDLVENYATHEDQINAEAPE
jgi:hypothetical protein